MPLIPSQQRYVDPFDDIYSDKVNRRIGAVFPKGSGRCSGLEVTANGLILNISPGICVCDYVVIQCPQSFTYDMSGKSDGDYYLCITYQYQKTQPPPTAYYDVYPSIPSPENQRVVLKKVTKSGNSLILSNDGTESPFVINSNLDMNGYKIINLGNPTNNSDAANKQYVDSKGDVYVAVQSGDSWRWIKR